MGKVRTEVILQSFPPRKSPICDRAKFHPYAVVHMSHPGPMETIPLSIILEHEKMLGEILG